MLQNQMMRNQMLRNQENIIRSEAGGPRGGFEIERDFEAIFIQ
jgi:hypothetical protein